jgi:cysteine-rich repeat protein
MRTWAFIVVLAATFAVACGDNNNGETEVDSCDNAADGTSCGTGQICRSNACVNSTCGDGFVAASEECDDGNTVSGDGCEAKCRFTCLASDATRNCAPADACAGQGVCSAAHTCMAGTPLPDGNPCGAGAGNVCVSGVCTSPLCGNGTRDLGEDCDDGNTTNLDGCDSACAFEQSARVTSLIQQFVPDAFCTKNALGTAIPAVPEIQDFLQSTWAFPVSDGSLSLVFKFLGFIDPSGARSTFSLGFIDATPVRFNLQDDGITFADGYLGSSDLDWWYTLRDPANNTSVDANGTPTSQLTGEVTNGRVIAGPGTIENLRLLFALAPANVKLFNVHIDATFDATLSKPMIATAATPPGHLASEHLSPDFSTFESSGLSSPLGRMCSDVSAKSMAEASPGLLGGCADPIDPTGSTSAFPDNHLLDVFILGCQLFTTDPTTGLPGFVPTILPTQPDGSLNGSTYTFAVDPTTHQVTSCTKDGQPGDLTDCLANATYSSYFQFAADRVIIRADTSAVLPTP